MNYWAILVGAVVYQVLGAIWYGPLFGKHWMKLMRWKPSSKDTQNMGARYFGAFVCNLVQVAMLAFVISWRGISGVIGGLTSAFWVWLGFIATVSLGSILWDNKPFTLWILNNAYNLLGLLVAGVILGVWI